MPIYDDVQTLTGKALRRDVGQIDLITAGFPCQDASVANAAGRGADGERTSLFREALRISSEMGRTPLLLENVPNLLRRGFGHILGALADNGFDAQWDLLSASALGAPHWRKRLFVLAYPRRTRLSRSLSEESVFVTAYAAFSKHGDKTFGQWSELERSEPVLRGGDGVSLALERRKLKQYGNAVVPLKIKVVGTRLFSTLANQA